MTMLTATPHPALARHTEASLPDLEHVVRSLLRGDAFPHVATGRALLETHISWVILAGPYAYKIKKPVNLGFLDFSTLEQRRADCEREVQLNRRFAPDVYLGIVEIVARDGRYAIGGPGEPVEPAVSMRRLPDAGMLTVMLEGGQVDARLARRIARKLAALHATVATGPGIDEHGSVAAIRANWQENFAQTRPAVGVTLSPEQYHAIARYVDHTLSGSAALFQQRVAEGRIRDGHGDLHAGSICIEGRRIHFFDCLEFAPRYRCGDVAAEVAFLAMDFDHRGRPDLARAFVGAYVDASGDRGLLDLLDFYRCYRAYVRGKVLSIRLAQQDAAVPAAQRIRDDAEAYFDLAWTYAGGLARPALIVVMGLPATGKTSLAAALAGQFGMLHLSSDVVRKELAGLPPAEHRPEAFGAGLYQPGMTARTYAALRRRAARALRTGSSVILDATYGRRSERMAVRRLAARLGVPLLVLVCTADDATIRARLAARDVTPDSASDARLALWPALRAGYEDPTDLPDAVEVDTSGTFANAVMSARQAVFRGLRAARTPSVGGTS